MVRAGRNLRNLRYLLEVMFAVDGGVVAENNRTLGPESDLDDVRWEVEAVGNEAGPSHVSSGGGGAGIWRHD